MQDQDTDFDILCEGAPRQRPNGCVNSWPTGHDGDENSFPVQLVLLTRAAHSGVRRLAFRSWSPTPAS